MGRFMFTTVTFVSYQKIPFDITVCLLSSCSAHGVLLSFLYVFCFSSNLLLFYFCLIQSYWVSKVLYCLPLVCSKSKMTQKKRSCHGYRILFQQIFLLLGSAYYFFTTFFMIIFDVNVAYSSRWGYSLINTFKFKKKKLSIDQIGWVPTRNTYSFPYSYAHTEPTRIYICTYVCIIMYMYLFSLICIYMYTHVYMFIPIAVPIFSCCTGFHDPLKEVFRHLEMLARWSPKSGVRAHGKCQCKQRR